MKRHDGEQKKITVFGAGIAGLTAAHELAMRGFEVQVIDAEFNAEWHPLTHDRGIGGMARSQWAVAPEGRFTGGKMRRLWSGRELLLDTVIDFTGGGKALPMDVQRTEVVLDRLAVAIQMLRTEGLPPWRIRIFVARTDDAGVWTDAELVGDLRVAYITDQLMRRGISGIERMFASWPHGRRTNCVYLAPDGPVAAAEHGFRFFPSFYRHLFDTMRRTPILFPHDSERTKATVFDNLVATDGLGFARDKDKVSFMVPRRAMSLEAMRKILRQVLEQLEYTMGDISRFSLKLFKYMTSSSERRKHEYECMPWGSFLDADKYSAVSREHIEYGPQMSAALRGSASDTRTQGNITIQLIMDQLKPSALADFTLAGPTSSAWFDHWHEFLIRQHVKFARGRLDDFYVNEKGVLRPIVDGADATGDYFVLALSLPEMALLAPKFLRAAGQLRGTRTQLDDMAKLIKFAGKTETLASDTPDGPLQHLSGIQYYFDQDVRFWRGHTQYLDSKWGLTSIAQPQFWARTQTPEDDYRSILSVDIGIFNRPYKPRDTEHERDQPEKCAWECTADEIAAYAWEQIKDHHDDAFKKRYGEGAKFPTPTAYALDATISFGRHPPPTPSGFAGGSVPIAAGHSTFQSPRRGAITRNDSPFLVNKTGAYETRPGNVNASATGSKCVSRYDVIAGRYVLAGTYMRTFTRLTSMEAANESARHAVNAFLQEWQIGGDRCDIWDPEDHELEDLQWLKDLDEELFERKLPHLVDILGCEELPDELDQLSSFATRFMRDRDSNRRRTP